MTQIYTQNDLIRYIFKETTRREDSEIENELLVECDLIDFYIDACDVVRRVKELKLEPSEKTIQAILDYSRSLGVHS
jgi:prophage tail gpP-like protein